MGETADTFRKRTNRVNRRHEQIYLNGARTKIGRDGLITTVPRKRMQSFPLRGFAILFLAAILYKSVMLAWIGPTVYAERVGALADGTVIEQAGAWLLQADPATVAVAGVIGPFLPR